MFSIETEFKGFKFTARCVVSVEGNDESAIATVTFFNDHYGGVFFKKYPCDLSGNKGIEDVEGELLKLDEYKDATAL